MNKALLLLSLGFTLLAYKSTIAQSHEIEKVIYSLHEAYNSHDLPQYLSHYSDDIKVYRFPSWQIIAGKDQLKRAYEAYFSSNPKAKCRSIDRTTINNTVVDHTMIYDLSLGQDFDSVAIYIVAAGKITEVYLLQKNL